VSYTKVTYELTRRLSGGRPLPPLERTALAFSLFLPATLAHLNNDVDILEQRPRRERPLARGVESGRLGRPSRGRRTIEPIEGESVGQSPTRCNVRGSRPRSRERGHSPPRPAFIPSRGRRVAGSCQGCLIIRSSASHVRRIGAWRTVLYLDETRRNSLARITADLSRSVRWIGG